MKPLPNIDDCENFSEAESLEYVTELIEQLQECEKSLDKNAISDLVIRLSSIYFDLEDYLPQICEILLNKHVIQSVYYFILTFSNSHDMSNDTLNLLYVFLINFTDYSQDFARAVFLSEIFTFIIDICLDEKNLTNINKTNTLELIKSCLKILNNCLRNTGNVAAYRLVEFKMQLGKFIKLNVEIVAVLAMLALAYIVEDKEIHLLNEGSDVVDILLHKVQHVLKSDGRSSGFGILELMNGIRCISYNDKMKKRIHQCGGIPIFLNIITRNDESELESTLGAIWNLCFDERIKDELVNVHRIESVIEPFAQHSNNKIKRNYEGIIWEISGKYKSITSSSVAKFDVFISYSWDNKPQINTILSSLQQSALRVWIDETQMVGNVLDAMATGIQNSALILVAMSRSYMKSSNCRSEVEYAYKRKKTIIPIVLELRFKPDGWLDMIVGMKMYYEFSERRQVDQVVQDLIKSIRSHLAGDRIENKPGSSWSETCYAQCTNLGGKAPVHTCILSDEVKSWTSSQVTMWLEANGLAHLSKKLATIDGSLLEEMVKLQSHSPEYFNKTLRREFNAKFVDVLKFHRALNSLISI